MKQQYNSLDQISGTKCQTSLSLNSALSSPWAFLRPTKELHSTIADTAKIFLDPLAFSVSDSQSARQHNHRKRKRTEDEQGTTTILRLNQLHVDGFTSDQIWEQAIRIFDSACHEIERDNIWWAKNLALSATMSEEEPTLDSPDSIPDDLSEQSIVYDEENGPEDDLEVEETSQSELSSEGEEPYDSDESFTFGRSGNDESKNETYTEDRFGLNDGFFSIDDFNTQTELFERQDAQGESDDNEDESDEEGINWHANPLAAGNSHLSMQETSLADDNSRNDDDDDEEGPTFGNMGLRDPPESDDDDDTYTYAGGHVGVNWIDTSDIMYTDFFAPPPRKASAKKSRPLPKTQPRKEISENDIDRAMADVRRDLFEDEASAQGSDNEVGETNEHRFQHSSHEKQRARIADEIRRLEAANVAKKEWMLSGEARAVERPINSLIEEDLDFERIGKPVPVVTTELSESIEELVKRRIIAKEFDEVVRRRPGLSDRQEVKKARIELDDSKPQQSLAELYETDHLRATDPDYVDPRNQKLMKEHADISNLWKEISSQLDTLSNWHYKPRAPQASINVVTDVATIMVEDAQPATSSAVRGSATLAPQEVYAPQDETRAAGELVMRSGVPITKGEMSRDDKAKLRRRQKKQSKPAVDQSGQQHKKAEKQQLVSDLKKAGVKLIGNDGEVTDIQGNKISGTNAKNGAYTMKL